MEFLVHRSRRRGWVKIKSRCGFFSQKGVSFAHMGTLGKAATKLQDIAQLGLKLKHHNTGA